MDAAKNAVKDFMSKSGHHDTTVHEKVAPAVTHEQVDHRHHENVQTAIDKEVHQDHYHTSVQPVKDREVLPEQHHHNLGAVEHRTHHHGNERDVADRLKTEAAQYTDTHTEGAERHTQSVAPVVAGEHIHHHVHETIQPMVNKETIEPHVTHTTVPIHEVHHNSAQHHSASALPAVSMAEFKKQGGVLTGREERYDGFEGEPRSVGGHSSHTGSGALAGAAAGSTIHDHHVTGAAAGAAAGGAAGHHHGSKTSGTTGSGLANAGAGSGTTGSGLTGTGSGVNSGYGGRDGISAGHPHGSNISSTTGSGLTGAGSGTGTTGSGLTGTGSSSGTTGSGLTGTGSSSGTTGSGLTGAGSGTGTGVGHNRVQNTTDIDTKTKSSLLQKLNPMQDADGDGKKGMMD